MLPAADGEPPMAPDDSFSPSVDELPSVIRARLAAEVATRGHPEATGIQW
jgi:hypothetical protein